jgi:oligopeptide transport system ATP-binding protein
MLSSGENMTQINQSEPLLEVTRLKKHFYIKRGWGKYDTLKAVDGVSFSMGQVEGLGLVGESGCGKTTLGRTVLCLYRPTSGSIRFEGKELSDFSENELRNMRARMQIIFQDPYSSLNPRMTVGNMLQEILLSHAVQSRREREEKVQEIIKKVGLETAHLRRFPHEFSGGQRQRIAFARALILNPKFVVADEPTSALDMSIQAEILDLMKSLQQEFYISYLFITHNLSAARFICQRVAVMYLGKIIELADHPIIFENPSHPYTVALRSLVPTLDPEKRASHELLPGDIPSPVNMPSGCRFHPRCPSKKKICKEEEPDLIEVETGHFVACHFPGKIN